MANVSGKEFVVGVLQLAVTLALTALVLYLALVVKMESKWLNMLIMTTGIFAFTDYATRDEWGCWRYRLILTACLIIHTSVLLTIQAGRPPIPLAYFGMAGIIEVGMIVMVVLKACE